MGGLGRGKNASSCKELPKADYSKVFCNLSVPDFSSMPPLLLETRTCRSVVDLAQEAPPAGIGWVELVFAQNSSLRAHLY